ncbi:MAG: ATP-binding protein, partial [Chloroflexi bacterium]|nr:ATP-binding protein [Chloroflexota bacterium]
CENGRFHYYGLITDLQLGSTDPRFADEKSDRLQPAIQQALLGKTLYTTLMMYPTLLMDIGPEFGTSERSTWEDRIAEGKENPGPKPVKTVPAHHAEVRQANEADVAQIFGEAGEGMFVVGHTIEQGYPVRLDLKKFVKRSSGIFGATGTGKSFLTRMVLAGLMRENVAAALVFDMHNEYAFDDTDTDRMVTVRGLRTLFGSKVQVAALGKGAMVRGKSPDFTLEIALKDFQTGDIELLSQALNLTDTSSVTLNALYRAFGDSWFAEFMKLEPGAVDTDPESGKTFPADNSVAAWSRQNNVHEKAAEALHRKLAVIYDRPYVVERSSHDFVSEIVDKLENGRHVILGFGEYDNDLDYLLVSNILTRRIRNHWVKKTERHKTHGEVAPRPLLIAIEEAHKLLNPQLSGQTTFGIIA